jgi:L-seryl-tRNA(Ser) seleniumtransferase
MPKSELRRRSSRFQRRLQSRLPAGARIELVEGNSVVGGGSCPDINLATLLLAVGSDRLSAGAIEERLRGQNPPVIIRLESDRALMDLRTVFPAQETILLNGVVRALS